MYPQDSPNIPATGGGYVPYFYQAGLHQRYALPSPDARQQPDVSPNAFYDFTGVDSPFGAIADPQTVEQIVAHGYFAVPDGDPITAIISDKQQTSRLGLDDVISQIRQRYEIHERNVHHIELAKCAAINAIYLHEAYCGPGSANDKQQYAKHKAIQGLYEEQRLERVNLWRDVSRIKLLLPESAQQYLSAHRKVIALNAPPGDVE